jgi:hypothetical protein
VTAGLCRLLAVCNVSVSMVETQAIDRIASEADMPDNMNEVSSIMASVSPLLDPSELAYAMY